MTQDRAILDLMSRQTLLPRSRLYVLRIFAWDNDFKCKPYDVEMHSRKSESYNVSEWDTWFRGFMKGWFSALIVGLSSVDDMTRDQILEKLQGIKAPSAKLADFEEAWKKTDTPQEAKELISKSLDAIPEIDSEVGTYFKEWCGTLMKGIKVEREDVRRTLLAGCGQTCNETHAQSLFKDSWSESDGMEDFIKSLNSKMGGDHDIYELKDDARPFDGQVKVGDGSWRLGNGGDAKDVESLAGFLKQLPDTTCVDLQIARITGKDDTIARGDKIAEDISALFDALMPLYKASTLPANR